MFVVNEYIFTLYTMSTAIDLKQVGEDVSDSVREQLGFVAKNPIIVALVMAFTTLLFIALFGINIWSMGLILTFNVMYIFVHDNALEYYILNDKNKRGGAIMGGGELPLNEEYTPQGKKMIEMPDLSVMRAD